MRDHAAIVTKLCLAVFLCQSLAVRQIPAAIAGKAAHNPSVEQNEMQLYLHYAVFDPLKSKPQTPAGLSASTNNCLFIVQLTSTPDDVARRFLWKQGATLWRYLPENAYLIEMQAACLASVRASSFVRWIGPYEPAYRIEPALRTEMEKGSISSSQGLPCNVQVLQKGAKMLRDVAGLIERTGGTVQVLPDEGCRLVATMTPAQITEAARCNAVCYIERVNPQLLQNTSVSQARPEKSPTAVISMQTVRELCGADYVEKMADCRGQGVHGSIIDTYARYDHVDYARHPILFAGPLIGAPAFHGNSVTGILFGAGAADASARGLLPDGQAVFSSQYPVYSVRGKHISLYRLMHQLLKPPFQTVFQSSSTGAGYAGTYDMITAETDDVVLDSDMLICQGLGNSGERTQESPAWAKNVVSVGGMDHQGTVTLADDRWATGASCGPTDDLRIKPDLSHFCTGVYCTGAASKTDYQEFMGTSAATPLVAGHFGLMYEMWAKGLFGNPFKGKTVFDARPHAATAKAMMINTAAAYEFSGDDARRGRCKQGWGLPDVRNLYDLRNKFFIVDQTDLLRDNQTQTYSVHVAPGEPFLKATLAYTDVPGAACAARFLVNSLTLAVISPTGIVYNGNHGLEAGNWSTPGGDADTTNNVQNVFVKQPESGIWIIKVHARRIALDQHRATPEFDSDFALVVSGVKRPASR